MKKIAILTSILAILPVIADAGINKKSLKKAAKKQVEQQVKDELRGSKKSDGNMLSSFGFFGSGSEEVEAKSEKKEAKQKVARSEVKDSKKGNVLDGNPLYMPKAGHFVSVTSVGSHTEGTPYALAEEFGYGITDKLAVSVETSLTENKAFDEYIWDYVSLGATYRALDMNGMKLDVYGKYTAGDAGLGHLDPEAQGALMYHLDDKTEWFDKEASLYTWTAGVRAGYTFGALTLAGHAAYEYLNLESFNWNDEGLHRILLGADAHYVICPHLSVLAGAEYAGYTDSDAKNDGSWTGEFGVNYNIDSTKYVGAYISGSLNHHDGDKADEWGWNKGFGFGAKFGIDF